MNPIARHFVGDMADALKHHKQSFVESLSVAVRHGDITPEEAKVALARAGLTTTGIEGDVIDASAAIAKAGNFTMTPVKS